LPVPAASRASDLWREQHPADEIVEAGPCLNAGIQYLREQGVKRIALIAHSCDVHAGMAWLEQQGNEDYPAAQRPAEAPAPMLVDIHPASRQIRITDTDRHFKNTIRNWQQSSPAGWRH
jgi:hypothetical protein